MPSNGITYWTLTFHHPATDSRGTKHHSLHISSPRPDPAKLWHNIISYNMNTVCAFWKWCCHSITHMQIDSEAVKNQHRQLNGEMY